MNQPLRTGDRIRLRSDVFSPYDEISESMAGEVVRVVEDTVTVRFHGEHGELYGFYLYEVTACR